MFRILHSEPSNTTTYVPVNGRVFKFDCELFGTEVFAADALLGKIVSDALLTGSVTPPSVEIKISEATEADLCAAQKQMPSKTLEFEQLLAYTKASNVPPPEPGPLRVEIVNAGEFQKDTVISVRRDQSGQLAGATAVKV